MAYDSAIITYTTKTDKVDIVAAAHINAVQTELVTIETILGTNVKGDRTDLKTRLNNALDADGSILSGSSFPSPALPTQLFYRTDLDVAYFRNAANGAWNSITTLACHFSAYMSSTANLTINFAKMSFNTEDFDIGSNYDAATNYRFTAPTTGKYIFTVGALLSQLASSANAALYKNGSIHKIIAGGSNDGGALAQAGGLSGSCIVSLTAGDYIELWARASTGTTTRFGFSGASHETQFTGALIQGS